jgi:hypothetical protein
LARNKCLGFICERGKLLGEATLMAFLSSLEAPLLIFHSFKINTLPQLKKLLPPFLSLLHSQAKVFGRIYCSRATQFTNAFHFVPKYHACKQASENEMGGEVNKEDEEETSFKRKILLSLYLFNEQNVNMLTHSLPAFYV